MQRVARNLGVELVDHGSWFEVVDEDGEVLGTIDENGVHSRC
jgi:cytochrome oxidase Cu insertion factor (SCO1/SenC/PrrC family)